MLLPWDSYSVFVTFSLWKRVVIFWQIHDVYKCVNRILNIILRSVCPADLFKSGHQHVLCLSLRTMEAEMCRRKCGNYYLQFLFPFGLWNTQQLTLSWTCIQQCCLLQQILHKKLTFRVLVVVVCVHVSEWKQKIEIFAHLTFWDKLIRLLAFGKSVSKNKLSFSVYWSDIIRS